MSKIEILIECPICRKKGTIKINNNLKEMKKPLLIVDVPNIICRHRFQAYVDKQGHIRGYQIPQIKIKKKQVIKIEETKEDRFRMLF